jgi:hypothetical protein
MKAALLALLLLALALAGFGLFGVADYLTSLPGWAAVVRDLPHGEPGTVPAAYQDQLASLDRARNTALVLSVASLAGGLGLGAWVGRTWFRRVRGAERPAAGVCTICGAGLMAGRGAAGLCDFCWERAS